MSRYAARLREAEAKFKEWTKDHALTALEEGAGMRRLVVQKPGTWAYGYTITTWPNYLAITGDLGCYVFTRLPDMFEFFRGSGSRSTGGINPGYWSEKVVAKDRNGIEEFDIETLRESIQESLDECDNEDLDERYAKMLDRLKDFSDAAHDEHGAVEAMMEYESDAHERNHRIFTHQFLWCLHAIVLAIRLYDEQKAKGACEGCHSCQDKKPGPGGVRACPRCDHELCPRQAQVSA